jgi:hypothetical protein
MAHPLVNAVLMNTVMFSAFFEMKQHLNDDNGNYLGSALLAGVLSSFTTACISTPTDYVKIQALMVVVVIIPDSEVWTFSNLPQFPFSFEAMRPISDGTA